MPLQREVQTRMSSTGTPPKPITDPNDPNWGLVLDPSDPNWGTRPDAQAQTTTATPSRRELARRPADHLGSLQQVFRNTLGDVVIGALRGGGETAINLGALLHKIPGVSDVVDKIYGQEGLSAGAFDAAKQAYTQPTNTAQTIGKGAEQVAELFVPATKVAQGARGAQALVRSMLPTGGRAATVAPLAARVAVEGVGGAAMSAAQGGDATMGGVLSAGMPLGSGIVAAVPARLKAQASRQVMQALGPTKEKFKAMAERITPGVLRRGLTGSRESLGAESAEQVQRLGAEIDTAIQAYGDRVASTQSITDALEASKDAFLVRTASGDVVPIDERAIRQIDKLKEIIVGKFDRNGKLIAPGLGDTATVKQLVAIRRQWDEVVSRAGGFDHRSGGGIGVPLADQSEAAIKREASSSIRALLDVDVPELSAINKEYSFWRSLDDVLTQTLQRTAPQTGKLAARVTQGAGATVGALASTGAGPMGIIGGAALGGAALKMLTKAVTSPRWMLTSAKLKDQLADVLASGNYNKIIGVLGRITAVQASKVGGE